MKRKLCLHFDPVTTRLVKLHMLLLEELASVMGTSMETSFRLRTDFVRSGRTCGAVYDSMRAR